MCRGWCRPTSRRRYARSTPAAPAAAERLAARFVWRSREGPIELDDLIDELETALAEGRRLPFTTQLLVDEERLLDIIDRMRVAVPEELKDAQRIIDEQEQLLADAQARVQGVLDERGLMAAVDAERERLIQEAEREAQSIRAGADAYARQVLQELEQQLARWVNTVQNGLRELK